MNNLLIIQISLFSKGCGKCSIKVNGLNIHFWRITVLTIHIMMNMMTKMIILMTNLLMILKKMNFLMTILMMN